MIFKRRDPPSPYERVRAMLAPRKGFWRGLGYVNKRMRRLPDSPHRIALGFACGALASFTPFFGLHFFIAAGFAWVVRANIVAAVFGTLVGNPLTFPLIATTSLSLGRWMLGLYQRGSDFEAISRAFAEGMNALWGTVKGWFGYGPSSVEGLHDFMVDIFLPYLVGGIVPGLVVAAICYLTIGPLVAAYQQRRRKRLLAIQAHRRAQLDAELSAYEMADGGEGDNA